MRWLRVGIALGLGAATLACGSGGGVSRDGAASDDSASPVLVTEVPAGFRAVAAGRGTDTQEWGNEEVESGEPFTVLAPRGEGALSDRAVLISTSGVVDNLFRVGCCRTDPERFRVDGRDAEYAPAGSGRWAELVVVRSDDVVLRIVAARGSRDDLVAIARRVRPPADHTLAPTVPHPPAGLRVVGSVDAGAVVSMSPSVLANSDEAPGLAAGFGTGWVAGSPGPAPFGIPQVVGAGGRLPNPPPSMALVAYPGRTADLAALAGLSRLGAFPPQAFTPTRVAGRPALLLDKQDVQYHWATRTLFTHAAWGDLLVLSVGGDVDAIPAPDAMVAILASARQAPQAEWDAFVQSTHGGPSLHADAGAVELARGTVRPPGGGEVTWLLQAWPGNGATGGALDNCLKLSTGRRACATGGGSAAPAGTVLMAGGGPTAADPDAAALGEFVMAAVDHPGAKLRVDAKGASATGDLHQIPGTHLWAGIVFLDGVVDALPKCPGTGRPPRAAMTVTLEDAGGAALGCISVAGELKAA